MSKNQALQQPMAASSFFFPASYPRRTLAFSSSPQAHFSISCLPQQVTVSPISKALAEIESSGIIACLRAESGELAMEAARAALDSGISVVIRGLVQDHPTSIIGAGTVLNVKDAQNAIKAGAKFLMSPATIKLGELPLLHTNSLPSQICLCLEEILDEVQGGDVLYVPGVMTPTEVLSAYNAGAKIVKVYPISALGGAQYISTLKKPFSYIPMIASQGITIDSIRTYITRGASAVVLSDAIFEKEALCRRNFDSIHRLAHHASLQGIDAVKWKTGESP